jgi:thiamine-monophosphate kinase
MSSSPLNEFELIARLTRGLPPAEGVVAGVGDDCTILDLHGDLLLLATCDSQVEGVHFTLETSQPEQIGRKALAINVSDIAAMGGIPRYALVSLILPTPYSVGLVEDIYAGLRQEAERTMVAIVGGNISGAGEARKLIIDITLLGTVERGHAITRSGARPGDILCVTGSLGDSAAGLYTLFHPDFTYSPQAREYVRARCRTPQARVPEGRILSSLGPQIITAMLDISDGLSGDVLHICEQSNVGVRIETPHLPISAETRSIATSSAYDPLAWALHGGEDYELLFTVAPGHEQAVRKTVQDATGTPVTPIGTITSANQGATLVYSDRREEQLISHSWDHLR